MKFHIPQEVGRAGTFLAYADPSIEVFYHYGSQDKHNEQHFAEEQHYPHYFHTPAGRVCDHHGGADSYAAPMLWSRNVYAHDQTQATPSH